MVVPSKSFVFSIQLLHDSVTHKPVETASMYSLGVPSITAPQVCSPCVHFDLDTITPGLLPPC